MYVSLSIFSKFDAFVKFLSTHSADVEIRLEFFNNNFAVSSFAVPSTPDNFSTFSITFSGFMVKA